jgi:hypothetical protein
VNMKSILLGGAVAMALSGAGIAQQPGANAPTNTNKQSHVIHHRHHHAASVRVQSSRAKRRATRDLNDRQLRMTQYNYAQGYARGYNQGLQSAEYAQGQYPRGAYAQGMQPRGVNPAELGSPGMQSGGGYPQAYANGPNAYSVQTAWGTRTDVTGYGPRMTAAPNSGYTPVRRIPNGNPFGTAAAGGGNPELTSPVPLIHSR